MNKRIRDLLHVWIPNYIVHLLGSADELSLALFLHWTQGPSRHQLQTEDVHELELFLDKPSKLPEPLCCHKILRMEKITVDSKTKTTWPASWETYMQVRKQQLELDMEQQTGSK